MFTNKILLSVALVAGAASAHADVTVNTTTVGKASVIDVSGNGVNQIKGTRQRTDQTVGGKSQTLIIDIDGRRFVDLDVVQEVNADQDATVHITDWNGGMDIDVDAAQTASIEQEAIAKIDFALA